MTNDGYLTPLAAFKAAKNLHAERRWTVRVRLAHARRHGTAYVGDEQRRAGRTAEVTLDLVEHSPSIEELVEARNRALELGYHVELESGGSSFTVLGPAG